MWKCYSKSKVDPAFYVKVEVCDEKLSLKNAQENRTIYKVSITNYVKLWSGGFDIDDIIKIMVDSNKSRRLEANRQVFLKAGLDILSNPKQVDKVEFTESSDGHLNVVLIRIGAIVFSMNFTLSVCCADEFFDIVTRPLLLIIDDQKKRETELRKRIEGMRSYLSRIPRDVLMRYEKQDIEDYNDVSHMATLSVMENVFGKETEEGIDPSHILYGRPLPALPYNMSLAVKDEHLTDPSSSDTTPAPNIKKEADSQQTESNNESSFNNTNGTRQVKSESKNNSHNSSDSLKGTNEGTDMKLEPDIELNQLTPQKKLFVDQEQVKTEVENSRLNTMQRHGVLTPKKRRKNLNY